MRELLNRRLGQVGVEVFRVCGLQRSWSQCQKRANMVDHDTNRHKAARNASDVKSDTSSMCAAF